MMEKNVAVYMTTAGEQAIANAYHEDTRKALAERLRFTDGLYDENSLESRKEDLARVEYIFSTWGMFRLTEAQIRDCFPSLKAVFYAAGSVQDFARPYLKSGVKIYSAFAANAVPVCEYAVAQIILANKGFYQASRRYKAESHAAACQYMRGMPGNFGEKVGILGAGAIGSMVIGRLREYNLSVLVFDPFLPDDRAAKMGVRKSSLDEIFSSCQTISNHLANNAQTKGMLSYALFGKMRRSATFINTGRGAQVVEEDLARALREEPDRTAVLDVTWPEPAELGHPFYTLPNVFLTPHIAGSMNDEIARMGRYMAEEYDAFSQGKATRYEVTAAMLKTMA